MSKPKNDFGTKIKNLIVSPGQFDQLAMEVFSYQASENETYKRFLSLIGVEQNDITSPVQIPFLPISFFKTRKVVTGQWDAETWFESSATTGQVRSRHLIPVLADYYEISVSIFTQTFGDPAQYAFIGLLPTYIENPHSSLIEMVRHLGFRSGKEAVFVGLDFEKLSQAIQEARKSGRTIFIFGVTYAFLQLLEPLSSLDLKDTILVETGGMKGLGKEMPKAAIKSLIREKLSIACLFSEFGMSEMQSQAYARELDYTCGFSMKAMVRQLENPLGGQSRTGRGALNIIDLGNWQTCSFLATDDAGEVLENGDFRVFGRVDGAEVRGCNLLFAQG